MRRRTVSILARTNADSSVTFSLRWTHHDGSGRTERFRRTEANPSAKSLAEQGRQAADARFRKEQRLHDDDTAGDRYEKVSCREGMVRYIDNIDGRLAKTTVDRRRRALGGFVDHIGLENEPRNARNILPGRISSYVWHLKDLSLAGSTINTLLADLHAWFNWLIDEGLAKDNPVRPRFKLTLPPVRCDISIIGATALWALLDKFEGAQRDTIGLIAVTGMRVGEARHLVWNDWNEAELDIVPESKYESTKRHTRTLPIGRTARRFLRSLKRVNGQGKYIIGVRGGTLCLSKQINRWLKPHDVTPHDLRRWYRTSLEEIDCPGYLADDLIGHHTGAIRPLYAAYNIRKLAEWTDAFDEWLVDGKKKHDADTANGKDD